MRTAILFIVMSVLVLNITAGNVQAGDTKDKPANKASALNTGEQKEQRPNMEKTLTSFSYRKGYGMRGGYRYVKINLCDDVYIMEDTDKKTYNDSAPTRKYIVKAESMEAFKALLDTKLAAEAAKNRKLGVFVADAGNTEIRFIITDTGGNLEQESIISTVYALSDEARELIAAVYSLVTAIDRSNPLLENEVNQMVYKKS